MAVESFGWVHFWIVVGVACAIVEILTTAFFALPFALGALVTAIVAGLSLPVNAQWLFFAVTSLIMLFVIQYAMRRWFTSRESEEIKTNTEALIGREALVLEPIEGSLKRGSVKVGGEIWSAVTRSGVRFEKGDVVCVKAVDGAKVLVDTPAASASETN